MAITVNIYYSGKNGNAKKFAEEMIANRSGGCYLCRRRKSSI